MSNDELAEMLEEIANGIDHLKGCIEAVRLAAERLRAPPDLPEPSRSGHYS